MLSNWWSSMGRRAMTSGPSQLDLDFAAERSRREASRTPANPFLLGLDLGQSADYSALAVVERTESHALPQSADLSAKAIRYYACRAVKRWPLGTPYPQIVTDVATILQKSGLAGATLVIDGTGVGRPVVDMFRQARLTATLKPVQITAGDKERADATGYMHVAKKVLIGTVISLLQSRRLEIAARMEHARVIEKELADYRVKISKAANESFDAAAGSHDDLVIALALSCWWGERGGRRLRIWA